MAYSKFANQIKAFVDRVKAAEQVFGKELILGVAASLVDKSPVGDPTLWKDTNAAIYALNKGYKGGRFKANWVGGDGDINYTITDDIDPSGETSMLAIASAIPDDTVGKVFYISNSLPYALRLEDGWSGQAPYGMASLTVVEFRQIAKDAVLRVVS